MKIRLNSTKLMMVQKRVRSERPLWQLPTIRLILVMLI
uniref:Uncharacterized protein n=1 Tax=Proteus mirabilis TaxID=584 RepID=A0A1L5JPF2_PROMI|nr:hypothetical protein [Proteus mirabilis]APO17241.1 hypothetical protein [Proteus mirabilis]APO17325.1 hypothetical protein [Proteus mirabilis]APO17512.1 hypothetical protein [Proteus mirabilis]APO17845.1 hypothetical protein [Proteus mirabilis]